MKKYFIWVMIAVCTTQLFTSCNKEQLSEIQDEPEALTTQRNALPHTKQYPADVANQWFTLLTDIVKAKPYISPQALRIFTYAGISLYESVVPGMPSYQSIYTHITGDAIPVDHARQYYWPAAANAALARISTRIMQDYPTPNLTQVQTLESSFLAAFQSKATSEQLQLSIAFGQQVADIIYAWSRTDGSFQANGMPFVCPPYTPVAGAGNWIPTPPGFFLLRAPAIQGGFIPNIASIAMAPAPPPYSTAPESTFYQAAYEVYQLRNNISSNGMALFNNWRDIPGNYHPIAHILRITAAIINNENMNLEVAAAIYAQQNMASWDAVKAAFTSKFHYSLLRPVTYIRDAMGQSSWLSLPVTPQNPSYPDELAVNAAAIAILEKYVGESYAVTDSVHKMQYGQWSYSSLAGLLQSEVEARVQGGTIFRFCGDAGKAQGRLVADMIYALPFKKP